MQQSSGRWLAVLKLVFLLSGFTGLAFEVLWTRQLAAVVGSTSVAMTCVFSTFVVCLSLGALIAARLPLFDRRALAGYGLIEITIGAFGAAVTLVMLHNDVTLATWVPLTQSSSDIAVQMLATFVLIGIPTTLMGATLPILMNGMRSVALPSSQVTSIYAANVVGGALGALACGFLLLWKLGVTGTATLCLAINVALGAVALLLARRLPAGTVPEPRAAAPQPSGETRHPWLYPALAFLTGLFALSYELLWGRMAKLYMGDRTMATSSLLFIYLGCMALGSVLIGFLQQRSPSRDLAAGMSRFGALLGISAAAHLLGVAFIHFVIANPESFPAVADSAWPRLGLTLIATVVPVTILGMAFPFLMQTSALIDERPGLAVGVLYFINSLGSALGALFGGYFAPRSVGTLRGFLITSACVTVVAAACLLRGSGAPRRRLVQTGAAIAAVALAALVMPRNLFIYDHDETLVASNEDEYGIQLVTRDGEGHTNIKNNRIYVAYTLGTLVTNFTQEMIAYAACVLAERCDTVMNVGTGYGITAGAFTNFSGVKSIETIEVLPYICELQPMFGAYNFDYFRDPRVTRRCTDGRRALAVSDRTFDIIAVNVLDPYIPGSSGLFTVDFWKLARSRLAPGGVYAQLIWGPDTERLMQGLEQVFPVVLRFPGGWEDSFNVIALRDDRKPVLHLDRLEPKVRQAISKFSMPSPVAWFRGSLAEAVRLSQERDGTPTLVLHTDDMPILEYRWARGDEMSVHPDLYRNTSMFDSLQVHP